MLTLKIVHWQEGDAYLGYLLEYRDTARSRTTWPGTALRVEVKRQMIEQPK